MAYTIRKRVSHKQLKRQLQAAHEAVGILVESQQKQKKDPGQLIVAATDREIAQVTLGAR